MFFAVLTACILITENIYINSIYFTAITCETTLGGLISSDEKHIDVGPTRTVLSGEVQRIFLCLLFCHARQNCSIYQIVELKKTAICFFCYSRIYRYCIFPPIFCIIHCGQCLIIKYVIHQYYVQPIILHILQSCYARQY